MKHRFQKSERAPVSPTTEADDCFVTHVGIGIREPSGKGFFNLTTVGIALLAEAERRPITDLRIPIVHQEKQSFVCLD
ncbi:hypothetical protein EDF57_1103 [Novosphingobium sp. PhB55]|nr:hypothetical protein EDF57_1103 [Novosphingobium sp. PhB55]